MRTHHWILISIGIYLLLGIIIGGRVLMAVGSPSFWNIFTQPGLLLSWPNVLLNPTQYGTGE